jgi:hypothetical protein
MSRINGKYNVYAGYYEIFVTDKKLLEPKKFQGSFNSVKDVCKYIEDADEWTAIDQDIYFDMYNFILELDNPIGNVFKIDSKSGEVIMLSEETVSMF